MLCKFTWRVTLKYYHFTNTMRFKTVDTLNTVSWFVDEIIQNSCLLTWPKNQDISFQVICISVIPANAQTGICDTTKARTNLSNRARSILQLPFTRHNAQRNILLKLQSISLELSNFNYEIRDGAHQSIWRISIPETVFVISGDWNISSRVLCYPSYTEINITRKLQVSSIMLKVY